LHELQVKSLVKTKMRIPPRCIGQYIFHGPVKRTNNVPRML
jgi:hypothetical protein